MVDGGSPTHALICLAVSGQFSGRGIPAGIPDAKAVIESTTCQVFSVRTSLHANDQIRVSVVGSKQGSVAGVPDLDQLVLASADKHGIVRAPVDSHHRAGMSQQGGKQGNSFGVSDFDRFVVTEAFSRPIASSKSVVRTIESRDSANVSTISVVVRIVRFLTCNCGYQCH